MDDLLTDSLYRCWKEKTDNLCRTLLHPTPPHAPQEELSAVQSGVSAVVSMALQLQQDNQELVSKVVNLQVGLDLGAPVGSTAAVSTAKLACQHKGCSGCKHIWRWCCVAC